MQYVSERAKNIALRLITLRDEKTQIQVAADLGISKSTIGMYETGKRIPNDEMKYKIAQYYGATVQELFFD